MPVVPLDGPAAVRLADLASVFQDLRFVVDACQRLNVLLVEGESGDGVVIRALWSSALVAYSRCFASGKRLGLSESDIEALPDEGMAAHSYLRGLRDKHIAHSVNPFEQVRVGAVLGLDDKGIFGVVGVAHLSILHMSGTVEWVENLRLLASALARRVSDLANTLNDEVLTEARALDIEELRARESMRVTAPGGEQVARPRGSD